MGKTDSTGSYTYACDGASPGSPVLSDGHAVYTPGLSESRGGVSSYYANDRLGNLWTIDGSGKSQTTYEDFSGFGLPIAGSSGSSPFGFGGANGCQTDADTGLVLMGHRYYDTRLGRFISQDPIGDGDNWYAYCGNSPTNGVDPLGLEEMSITIPANGNTDLTYTEGGKTYSGATYTNNTDQDITITVDTDNLQSQTFNPTGSGTGASSPGTGASGAGYDSSTQVDTGYGGLVDEGLTAGTVTHAGEVFGAYDSGHASLGAAVGAGALAIGAIGAVAMTRGEGAEAEAEASAAFRLPDFTGWVLKQIEEHLGNAGFSEKELIEGSTSLMRTFNHADGSKVTLDMAKSFAKVSGPRQWASDLSQKFRPRFGPHNQPFLP